MQIPRKITPDQLPLLLAIVAIGAVLLRPDRDDDRDTRLQQRLVEALKTRNMPIAAAKAIARMGDEVGVIPIVEAAMDP